MSEKKTSAYYNSFLNETKIKTRKDKRRMGYLARTIDHEGVHFLMEELKLNPTSGKLKMEETIQDIIASGVQEGRVPLEPYLSNRKK